MLASAYGLILLAEILKIDWSISRREALHSILLGHFRLGLFGVPFFCSRKRDRYLRQAASLALQLCLFTSLRLSILTSHSVLMHPHVVGPHRGPRIKVLQSQTSYFNYSQGRKTNHLQYERSWLSSGSLGTADFRYLTHIARIAPGLHIP